LYSLGLLTFYRLYHEWWILDENMIYPIHYPKATLENIGEIVKKEAEIWIDKYVHGIEIEEVENENLQSEIAESAKSQTNSFLKKVIAFWMK
jgi:hypothetical protein